MLSAPTFANEARLWAAGYRYVAGLDEVGRGALAGPVVAAAVVVAPATVDDATWRAVRDSKQLSPAQRAHLEEPIKALALAWAIGSVPAAVIDTVGIAAATRLAMADAARGLAHPPDFLLIDWVRLPLVNIAQQSVPKADATMTSVAAASILAKVHRDRLMTALEATYPGYGFAAHKGYGAATHLAALARLGPCPEHRHSFAPIARPAGLFAEA